MDPNEKVSMVEDDVLLSESDDGKDVEETVCGSPPSMLSDSVDWNKIP